MVVVWTIFALIKMIHLIETHAYTNFTIAIATLLKILRTHPLLKSTDVLVIKFLRG